VDGFVIDENASALLVMGPEWNVEVRRAGISDFYLPFNELRDFVISRKRFAREGDDVFLSYGQDDNIYALPVGAGSEAGVAEDDNPVVVLWTLDM
jgi:hypothetical protein